LGSLSSSICCNTLVETSGLKFDPSLFEPLTLANRGMNIHELLGYGGMTFFEEALTFVDFALQ